MLDIYLRAKAPPACCVWLNDSAKDSGTLEPQPRVQVLNLRVNYIEKDQIASSITHAQTCMAAQKTAPSHGWSEGRQTQDEL